MGKIIIEHISAKTEKPFAEVAAALEPKWASSTRRSTTSCESGADARPSGPTRGDGRAERLHALPTSDHGALLRLAGQKKKAVQYLLGNPLFAVRMTQHDIRAGLYAPLRVLLYEDEEGKTCVEYDRPSSLFGQFGNANVTDVAAMLDRKLEQHGRRGDSVTPPTEGIDMRKLEGENRSRSCSWTAASRRCKAFISPRTYGRASPCLLSIRFSSRAPRAASAGVAAPWSRPCASAACRSAPCVRREDERAAALRATGAEVAVGRPHPRHGRRACPEGCRRVYFGMSVSAPYLEATVTAAAVARAAATWKRSVNMSQMTVSEMSLTETTDSPQHRQHWLAEQALNWSGLPVVHVRRRCSCRTPSSRLAARSILRDGTIRLPFGSGRTVADRHPDVAEVIAATLASPAAHVGKVYELTGRSRRTCTASPREYARRWAGP